jgi:hypothetical protein
MRTSFTRPDAYCLLLSGLCVLPTAFCLPPARVISSIRAAGSWQAKPPNAASLPQGEIACRVMEVYEAEPPGATVVIFHQRDKADGPRLGELLLAHSGQEAEFAIEVGKPHRAKVFRVKSCFGRGLLVFASAEAKLTAGDDFVLRFSQEK